MEQTVLGARQMRRGGSRELLGFLFCLVSAAAILMICSLNSFLYPLNRWEDVNCFVTVARGMLNGMMPYRDLAEQKGPLLYVLHALALWPNPTSYHGIYIVEVLAVAPFLCLCWRTLRLYDDKLSVLWMAPLAAFLCAGYCFRLGDSAEELCLPFAMASMYAYLRALRRGEPISARGYVAHGLLAGCVFWMKYSQLGIHFMFMAMQAVLAVWDDSRKAGRLRLGRAIRMCLFFLLGMLLSSVPWLIWFGVEGALSDMLRVYLYENIFGYVSRKYPVIVQIGAGMVRGIMDNKPMTAVMLLGLVLVLTAPKDRMSWREKGFLVLSAASTAVMVYGGGRRYAYYYFAFAPFVGFALMAVGPIRLWISARLSRRGRALKPGLPWKRALSAVLCAAVLALSAGYAYRHFRDARYIGLPWSLTPQGKFGAYIRESEDRTLLSLHLLDSGFYMAADVQPVNYYFCLLNNYEDRAMADQMAVIEAQRVHFLVTGAGETLEDVVKIVRDSWPELLDEGFEPRYHLAMEAGGYKLYERDADEEASA